MREVHKVQVLLLFVLVDEAWFEQSGLGVGGRDGWALDSPLALPSKSKDRRNSFT